MCVCMSYMGNPEEGNMGNCSLDLIFMYKGKKDLGTFHIVSDIVGVHQPNFLYIKYSSLK